MRARHEKWRRKAHGETRWAHFVNIALGCWIVVQPVIVQVEEPGLFWSEITLGAALVLFATLSLSWRLAWARWACAAVAAGIMAIPFLFWTTNPAAFLSDTLVGAFAFGLAVGMRPEPGTAAIAAMTWPDMPPGWSYNPSGSAQRLPIIFLALVGLLVARYLAAYQLGQIDGVWDPFFPGLPDDSAKNGTEAVITSSVSRAIPVPDAALGGFVYALEIVTAMADADHLIGFLALTNVSLATAEVSRSVRFCLIPLGVALTITPFVLGAGVGHAIASCAIGIALIALSVRRGPIRERYGNWDRFIV